MKDYQDQSRRAQEFAVDDWVWLRLYHHSAAGITQSSPSKLAPHFYGPFQVTARVGAVAYRLRLPVSAKIHDVFHVSLLKKFVGTPPSEVVQLPPITRGHIVPVPEHIVRARLNRGVWELLVNWKGCNAADATWESLPTFVAAYPEVQLEDALFLDEGGNVTDAFVGKVFSRRKKESRKSPAPGK